MLYEILEGIKYCDRILIEAVIIAALVFVFTVIAGKIIIPVLRAKKLNQPINGYVAEHASKSGTPTMGGICFIIASLLALLIWIILESSGMIGRSGTSKMLIPLALTLCLGVGNAMIGFIDDYKKLVKKENEGLSEIQKLILQVVVAAAYLFMMGMTKNLPTAFHIPFTNLHPDLGFFAYPIYLLVIVGFVNSTNITDGLDGLASSVGVAAAVGIIGMSVLKMRWFTAIEPVDDRYNAVVAASLLGALLGFLVFNRYPAKVFMGDTGSLYIGGIIMGCAISSGEFFAVILMSFVYVLDMLSSLLQRLYFKATHGKRIFKKAPVHHHFQLVGWSEIKIVTVFFIVSAIFTALGVFGAVI
ncbi:MAG: phospho-N-acetylmuramoyl-pentapeptide-transferase [Clostridia bacterium]|nr:phospho-N-acetylmuramoyl-pentapeptide-transferase [Clostridia bacterium]